jgi:hypothetical protein
MSFDRDRFPGRGNRSSAFVLMTPIFFACPNAAQTVAMAVYSESLLQPLPARP